MQRRLGRERPLHLVNVTALIMLASCSDPADPPIVDTTPPSIVAVSPTANATSVPVATRITATFSEALDVASVAQGAITVQQGGATVAGTTTYDASTLTLEFVPSTRLVYGETYTVSVADVLDLAQNALPQAETWSFAALAATTASVAITSHTDEQVITGSRSVTVAGTITDALPITEVTLTVNGIAAAVDFDNAQFSASVVLENNLNAIAVEVTNDAGNSATVDLAVSYPYIDLATFDAAQQVIGQPDFTTGTIGQASASSFNSYNWGNALVAEGTLYLSDYNNNRILGFNSVPVGNGGTADFVLGQPDFATATGGLSATQFSGGYQPVWTGSHFIAGDWNNNRFLVWNSLPTTTQAPADFALGQVDLNSAAAGCSATSLERPEYAQVYDGKLVVSDSGNDRILIWNTMPTEPGTPADLVLGQPNFDSCISNDDNGDGDPDLTPSARTLVYPTLTWSDGTRLVVADSDNNRVLIWNTFPTDSFQPADVVLGQPDFQSSEAGASQLDMDWPYALTSNGNQLFVADENNRILIWDLLPTSDYAPATAVLGQADFTHSAANDDDQDGTPDANPSARTLTKAYGLSIIDGRLWTTDSDNGRYLIFGP